MEKSDVVGILFRHGDDDFSLWQPENDPYFADFLGKHETDGSSVRGNGAEILSEVRDALGMDTPEVHVVVYSDCDCQYVGMDVFDSFEAALAQYNQCLQETRADHPDDPDWVTEEEHDIESGALRFRTQSDYEVFYRRENVQKAARHEIRCGSCGDHFDVGALGKKLFLCTNRHCRRLFCSKCHKAMTGKDVSEGMDAGYLCPYCQLSASVHRVVQSLLPDYHHKMPDSFYEAIIFDVQEDSGFNYDGGFNDDDITDAFEQVVYSLNQPAAARGNQSVFWNIAYFDRPYFEGMFENFVFPDGTAMQWASVNWLQKRFMRWFNEERRRKLLTFPVETVNLLDDGYDYVDLEWKDFVAEMWSKGHSFFVYRSNSVDSLASCCRLRNELQDNTFSYTLGAGGVSTGSKCVISINVNRLVQDAVWDTPLRDIMDRMEIQIEKIHKYLIAFNEILKERLAAGLLPVYDAGYIALDKQYLTIGVNGLVEGAEALNISVEADNPEYIAYVDAVLSPIYAANRAARTSELMFNTEMVPAEGLGVKNAAWDKASKLYVPRDCYNSYFFVVEDPTVNVLDKLRFHGKAFTRYLDGGSACHVNLDENLTEEQYLLLLNAAIHTGCNYLTFNVPNTLCNACGYISKHRLDACPKCGSRDLDYATRIIGYLKLISRFAHDRQIEAGKRHYSHGLEENHEGKAES